MVPSSALAVGNAAVGRANPGPAFTLRGVLWKRQTFNKHKTANLEKCCKVRVFREHNLIRESEKTSVKKGN